MHGLQHAIVVLALMPLRITGLENVGFAGIVRTS